MASGSKLRIIGVIPARLNSERLPGKVLRMLAGKAMLHHVYKGARPCPLLDDLLVATDADAVLDYCRQHSIPVRMTSPEHRSGTERIFEVMQQVPGDVYLNLQADEPLLTSDHVRLLIEPFLASQAVSVSTLKIQMETSEAGNPNIVKVVTDRHGRALYFSRAAIPHRRDPAAPVVYYKHLGLYGYTAGALREYMRWPPSALELAEKLEQLRFLDNGIPIAVTATDQDTVGVDTEADFEQAARLLASRSAGLTA